MTYSWLPNLFIAGVPKAGTSSLHQWLSAHPDALGAIDKEARFFIDPGSHIYREDFNISLGLEGYQKQFPIADSPPAVILDSTPAYIYQKKALEHIPALASQPRCIFILRDPASQIQSLFNYFQNNWAWIPANLSFSDYLDRLQQGGNDFGGNELARNALRNADYLPYLRRWRAALGEDRMLVCTFDELQADARGLTRRLAAWAGLDPDFYDGYDFPSENESYVPRLRSLQRINIAMRAHLPKGRLYDMVRRLYRRMNTTRPNRTPGAASALERLRASYAPHNAELAAEFGLDLSGWGVVSRPTQPARASMSS